MKRKVSLKALDYGKVEEAAKGTVRQTVTLNVGINDEKAREIGKYIKGLGAQGRAAPGAGRPAPRERQEARRPADGDRRRSREHDFGDPAAVHQLPRLTTALSVATSGSFERTSLVAQAGDALGRSAGGCVNRLAKLHLAAA